MQAVERRSRRRGEPPLDPVGEIGRAVDDHAQPVVIFAEIGILDHLLQIGRRHETADANAGPHDQKIEQRLGQHPRAAKPPGAGMVCASSATPCGGQRIAGPVGRHRTSGVGALLRPASRSPRSARERPRDRRRARQDQHRDRMSPRAARNSWNRHDRPVRSGQVPGGAGAMAKSPRLIAASAQARPPPENIA